MPQNKILPHAHAPIPILGRDQTEWQMLMEWVWIKGNLNLQKFLSRIGGLTTESGGYTLQWPSQTWGGGLSCPGSDADFRLNIPGRYMPRLKTTTTTTNGPTARLVAKARLKPTPFFPSSFESEKSFLLVFEE